MSNEVKKNNRVWFISVLEGLSRMRALILVSKVLCARSDFEKCEISTHGVVGGAPATGVKIFVFFSEK